MSGKHGAFNLFSSPLQFPAASRPDARQTDMMPAPSREHQIGKREGRMLVTTHAAVGALIGRASRTPMRAAVLGTASHLLLDSIPHWGTREKAGFLTVARIDGIAMLASVAGHLALAGPGQRLRVGAGIAGAVLPDLDKPFEHLLGIRLFPRTVAHLLTRIQREEPSRIVAETACAIIASVGANIALERSRNTPTH